MSENQENKLVIPVLTAKTIQPIITYHKALVFKDEKSLFEVDAPRLSINFPKIKQKAGKAAPKPIEENVAAKNKIISPESARAVHKYQKLICSVPLNSEF